MTRILIRLACAVLFALSVIHSTTFAATIPTATGRTINMSAAEWKIFIPSTYQPRGNVADLLVHFHGDPQTYWNNAKYANLNTIIVTVNYNGLSSVYSTPFSNSALFGNLMN